MSEVDTSAERRFLIRKNGYYYRPNSEGYTSSAIVAGRYTMDEAESITHPNGPDGPRDGMSFIAEHICPDVDWIAHCKAISQARSDALDEAIDAVHMECWTDGVGRGVTPELMAEQETTSLAINAIRAIKEATQEAP